MFGTTALRHVRPVRPRLTVRALLAAFVEADRRYRARRQLAALDDHLLRDIGLTRTDLAVMRSGRHHVSPSRGHE